MRKNQIEVLKIFSVDNVTRKYIFWKRDALPIELYIPEVVYQTLDYIHNNPVQGKWRLSDSPIEYYYSFAKFYETGKDAFGLLKHIGSRI